MSAIKKILTLVIILIGMTHSIYAEYKTEIHVASDGTGDYQSIQEAIDNAKSFPEKRILIFIKNGIYREKVTIPDWNPNISLIGEDMDTVIWDGEGQEFIRDRYSGFEYEIMNITFFNGPSG